jgi:hypothetical protein
MQEGGEGEPLVGRFVVYRQPPAPPLRRYHVVELVDGALVNAPPLPADAAWLTPVPQLAVFTLGWRVLETADGAVGVMVANAAVSAAGGRPPRARLATRAPSCATRRTARPSWPAA